jgi:hypothetical protein
MLFYDIEVFPQYWCAVIVDDESETRHVFEDVPSLRTFYKQHMKNTWVGYNSRQYDAPMLRFIMLGLDPYQCSNDMIVLNKKWFEFGYNITQAYKRIPLRNFDCVLLNKSLKKLEAFRGSSIKETSIPFDTDRILTRAEKDEIIEYCTHDVLETRKVFLDTKEEYDAHESLVSAFGLEDVHFNKSKAQMAALILGAIKTPRFDEWDFEIADTLKLEKYKFVEDWYHDRVNHDYTKKLVCDIAGVPHTFAWGGIHGAIPSYHGEGTYVNMDVASYYPAMMIEYGFLSRNVPDPSVFRKIRDDRMVMKRNKDPRQLPYKIVINGTYGAQKDKFNNLFDPRQANSICVTGQLLLLDLIEKLEGHCQIIQSNTDGVLVKLFDDADYDKIVSIGQEWSKRTRMELEYETVKKVFQKDVNNYLTVDADGKYKSKGAYVKKLSTIDYDLPIVNEAIVNQMVHGTPIYQTIYNCKELSKFQKIVMVSRKYDCGLHGQLINKKGKTMEDFEGEELAERILRVFASTDTSHGGIFKRHAIKKNLNKVSDTPTHAFIINDSTEGISREGYPLDLDYYVKMAEKRIKGFYSKPAVSI